MATAIKSQDAFFKEERKLDVIKILFFMKRIDHQKAIKMLMHIGYGPQGADKAVCYLESLGKIPIHEYFDHHAGIAERVLANFDERNGAPKNSSSKKKMPEKKKVVKNGKRK